MIKIFRKTFYGIVTISLCKDGLELYQSANWHVNKDNNTFYLVRKVRKKPLKRRTLIFHRELLQLVDKKLQVDHINGDGLDNRLTNLRIVTAQQNMMNRKKHLKGSSKYKGVSRREGENTWRGAIKFKGIVYYLGQFKTEKEAAEAYNLKALELFGQYANLNQI